MLSMKKLAKCSAPTSTSASGRVSRSSSPRARNAAWNGIAQRRIGEMGAAGDAGGVAADAGEDQAHTPATFSSIAVVIA